MAYTFLAIFVALTALDAWLTLRILAAGGHELNPIVRKAMDRFGNVKGMALVKVPTLILAAFLPLWLLLVLCALYGVVVEANAEVYFTQRHARKAGQ